MATKTLKKKKKTFGKYLVSNRTLPSVPGARIARMPSSITPMMATLTDEPFSDPEWLFETKFDGVRSICYIRDKKIQLVSRNAIDMSARYPELSGIAELVSAKEAILDGEIIALDENGHPSFQLLQSRIGLGRESEIRRLSEEQPVTFVAFDLIYYDDFDLTPGILTHRKALLKDILEPSAHLKFSEHVVEEGEKLFKDIQKNKMEGVIAKRASSLYMQKRSRDWLKIKTVLRQEVVIAGYTRPRGARTHLGALIVGLYNNGVLTYVGHVGGGFNEQNLRQVYRMLQSQKTKVCPFLIVPKTNEEVQWVHPSLVCEVKFSEWTADGKLRQPVFLGLRDDKDPSNCIAEIPVHH